MRIPDTIVATLIALACVARAEPIISEFMASNTASLADGDGNYSDWIEIHNPDATTADLSAWQLRDGTQTWSLPGGSVIQPGGYLIVFASGQASADYSDAAGNPHTTFKLDAAGEALALLRPDGSIAFEYASVPAQREDVSYGLFSASQVLVTPDSPARHLVPATAQPSSWREPGFDDSGWVTGVASVGYKTGPGLVLGGSSGAFTAYLVEPGLSGNQEYGGSLGMDFDVLEEIRITDLGVFDSASDGLARTITAQLWSRSGNSGGAILASETFTSGNPGTLEGGSRFKALATPLTLTPGSYTIVAYGYGPGEPNGNGLDGLDIDPGDGLLQFTGGSRYGNAGSFPGTPDGGPVNRYAAGSFRFSAGDASDFGTDVEASMLGANPSILVRTPFTVSDPTSLGTVQLEIGYDDGFIAWINGIEIARQGAPANPAFDSAATAIDNDTSTFPAALPAGTLSASDNILAIQGLNISAGDSDFVNRPTLLGVSNDVLTARYFTTPTPGLANDPDGIVGFVSDTQFSVDRGFYDAPFDVEITTLTDGAEIRYTLDGSEPSETHGTLYSGPITISGTTILRAVAHKADHQSTNIDTQSYLFLDQVAAQTNSPPGYPGTWAGIAADYEMDQNPNDYARAAGDASFNPGEARAAIVASLRAIPTISIVTPKDNLFDPSSGIYTNPAGRGPIWERPASVEIIGEDGSGRYQTDAGLRIMGFTSRNLSTTPKLNMRLLFKKKYGDAKLDYPLLGPAGPDKFNTIALRGNIRDAWVAENSGFGSATYIGDEWAKRSQAAMGQPAVRGSFAHIYLNGIYWGLYNPTERPDDDFAETHLGGDRSEYDVVKFCCPDRHIAGSITNWDNLLAESRAGLGSTAAYQRVQGRNPDGSPNPAFPVLLDVDNLIDYLLNGQYHSQADWPGNYYVIRDQVAGRTTGFQFFTWDNDIPFSGGNPNSGNKVQTVPGNNWWTESPGEMDIALRANADYRIRFADHYYKHFHHGGAMTVENNIARWDELATQVRPALFAESARWGDSRSSALRTVQDHWDNRNSIMRNSYFPGRQAVLLSQLRTHGLYPDLDAPEFNQHGGHVSAGFGLRFASDAAVYYTTDGSDPRLPGGAINPRASMASSGVDVITLVPEGAAVRTLVPADASVDSSWRDAAFDDGSWLSGSTGVGFEAGNGDYADYFSLDLQSAMYTVNSSVYLRIPFAGANAADFQSLTLKMKYDDGFIAYLNGTEIASRNPPVGAPAWDSGAGSFPTDQQAVQFESIDISAFRELLSPAANLLTIHGLNFGLSSSDFLIVPELVGESLGGGDSVTLDSTTELRARAFDGSEWSAINEATFIVGSTPAVENFAVSEIMYHPADGDTAGEFIEIVNLSDTDTIDLTNTGFTDGIAFAFPLGYSLAPGARALIVADPAGFATSHPGVAIAGTYVGSLDNGGERIAVSDANGTEFLAVSFDDQHPWPAAADGAGPSLVYISGDPNIPSNWRASTGDGGNPGGSDAVPYSGESLLEYALGTGASVTLDLANSSLSFSRISAADAASVQPQWSEDLSSWQNLPLTKLDSIVSADGSTTTESWSFPGGSPQGFIRLEVRLRD